VTFSTDKPRCKLDSHADTCAFGKHCHVIQTYSQSRLEFVSNVKLAHVAIAYDCPSTFTTYVLKFDHVLYIPTLQVNLLCVSRFGLRDSGVTVNDVPLIRLTPAERCRHSHSIIAPSNLNIPMLFDKLISYFECRKPTPAEVNNPDNFLHVSMTSSFDWEP